MANMFFCMTCKKECMGLVALFLHKSVFHKHAATKQNRHKGYWPKKGRDPWAKGIHRGSSK